ncbi:MAG: hypothetical protein E7311_05755 [Clostridiales bacterium]|nr:hypothetical protein [Clostridiales bacterium]
MIVRNQDKVEIYEDKNKSKKYLLLLIITLILLIISSIYTNNTSLHIEIIAYIIIILAIGITIKKINKKPKKVLEINKEFLTIIYKDGEEKIEINKIMDIKPKINMYIVNIEDAQDLPIFKKYVNIPINELKEIIDEYKNK